MPWIVGLDEAGYGPNLGPLVQAAVAARLPAGDGDDWERCGAWVRQAAGKKDLRVVIDDSKKVHVGKFGNRRLEAGVRTALGVTAATLGDWLASAADAETRAELAAEPWYDPTEPLPAFGAVGCEAGWGDAVEFRLVGVNVVPANLFNRVVAGSGSKATVLSAGASRLLAAIDAALPPGEPAEVRADQLGGRRFYGPLLQAAYPSAWLTVVEEGETHSRYRLDNLSRPLTVEFSPRADGDSLPAALASMVAKYLRELFMAQFNRHWLGHVAGLRPTAGYPLDAKRFFAEIAPAMAALGVARGAVWREK